MIRKIVSISLNFLYVSLFYLSNEECFFIILGMKSLVYITRLGFYMFFHDLVIVVVHV